MTTTAVFAEILTVGLQTLVWIALLIWVIVTSNGETSQTVGDIKCWLSSASDWAALASVLVLAMAYTAGVIIDRVADRLLGKLWKPAEAIGKTGKTNDDGKTDTVAFAHRRLYVRYKGGDISVFLDYVRSRLRIARATVLNIFVGGILLAVALWNSSFLTAAILGSLVALAAAVFAWVRINKCYDKRLLQAQQIIQEHGKR